MQLKQIINKLKKKYPKQLVRDVSITATNTVTFKLINKDDTWRQVEETIN